MWNYFLSKITLVHSAVWYIVGKKFEKLKFTISDEWSCSCFKMKCEEKKKSDHKLSPSFVLSFTVELRAHCACHWCALYRPIQSFELNVTYLYIFVFSLKSSFFEKATKIWKKNFHLFWRYWVKTAVLSNFMAFSKYFNFT